MDTAGKIFVTGISLLAASPFVMFYTGTNPADFLKGMTVISGALASGGWYFWYKAARNG